MLEGPRAADYSIWAVAALLYVVDAARLLPPRDVLLVEIARGAFTGAFVENPYTLGGRVLTFAPLLRPHRAAFVAPWGRPWTDSATLHGTLASLDQLLGALLVPRILAVAAFGLLFVIGPVLTWALGVNAAVAATGVVLYVVVLAGVVCLWWRRRAMRLTAAKAALISIEILICPAFLPNLVRKITTVRAVDADAAQLVVATAPADVRDTFVVQLEAKTEELIAETTADASSEGRLRAYLAVVKSARRQTLA